MSRAEQEEWLETIDRDQAICRDLLHSWRYETVRRVGRGFERQLGCTICSTIKIQKLDSRGFLLKSKYIYPAGYKRPAGLGRITRAENAHMRIVSMGFQPTSRRRRKA